MKVSRCSCIISWIFVVLSLDFRELFSVVFGRNFITGPAQQCKAHGTSRPNTHIGRSTAFQSPFQNSFSPANLTGLSAVDLRRKSAAVSLSLCFFLP
ncbi:hypothetical protein L6452_38321 [Arctium lappa]|uniref:Uncharacterized protein n=1 Tax=Arctium lappa TaxID=4217 RepID=A0ACB8Y5H8_ARCLA|nr:hypothetical protein L6452_38321 [Arctium lappa]